MFGGIGFQELLVILLIVLLLFGARRLPEFGKALGRGIKEFKRAANDIQSETDAAEDNERQQDKPDSASDNLSG